MALKVLLADDHRLTLEGIRRTLSETDDLKVVATATNGKEVMSLVAKTRPDIAVLDIRMPEIDGLGCLDLIRKHHPDVKVVMLSSFTGRTEIDDALRRGATAYVVKSVNPIDLPSLIRQACERTAFYAGAPAAGVPDSPGGPAPADHDLTERELTIARALGRGLTNKAIAKELWVTEQTVKFHLNNVYRKLGVENRTAAVRYLFDNRLIEKDDQALQPA